MWYLFIDSVNTGRVAYGERPMAGDWRYWLDV